MNPIKYRLSINYNTDSGLRRNDVIIDGVIGLNIQRLFEKRIDHVSKIMVGRL